jgi:hypothetical protein
MALLIRASTSSSKGRKAMTQAITRAQPAAPTIERVLIEGDLSRLTPDQKLTYYMKVCESLGLNPYTKPFDYLRLNGREILYARKDATDQLRKTQHVSIVGLTRERLDDLYVVTATARTPDGRTDSAIGAVMVKGLGGEALANALMKAETKAKRRVTLSICGLGMTDDSEVESIPGAQRVEFQGLEAMAEDAPLVDRTTGEVLEPFDPRDAALEEWILASDEARNLKIAHKDLPHNTTVAQIERWTEALHKKIAEHGEPVVAA